ncbi:MAG: chemotaxis protein CheX [Phycisphaerae bacterium]|nr:chemotaxis protein CheX [Phycisphaerae bacterium]
MSTDNATQIELPHSDAVRDAVKEILQTACASQATECEDPGSEVLADGVIIAVIAVMGDVEWSIFLGLPKSTAETMAQAFCGFEIPYDSEDMGDAIGEVTNVLAGNVKQVLDKRGVKVEISLPSVMRVQGLEVLKGRGSSSTKTCFGSQLGTFWTGVVAGKSSGIIA